MLQEVLKEFHWYIRLEAILTVPAGTLILLASPNIYFISEKNCMYSDFIASDPVKITYYGFMDWR